MNSKKHIDSGHVPHPCHVRWTSMTGTDTTRTCASCDRQVHDVSAMTTAEAEALLARGDERICVRVRRGPDGTLLTADRQPASTIERGPFAGMSVVALAAFIGLAQAAPFAAPEPQGVDRTQRQANAREQQRPARQPEGTLSGTVRHSFTRDPLGHARVSAIDELSGAQYSTESRDDGTFSLRVPSGLYTVSVTVPDAVGEFFPYGVGSVAVKRQRTTQLNVKLSMFVQGEWIRLYPKAPPPPLGTLDPRDGK